MGQIMNAGLNFAFKMYQHFKQVWFHTMIITTKHTLKHTDIDQISKTSNTKLHNDVVSHEAQMGVFRFSSTVHVELKAEKMHPYLCTNVQ